VHAPVALCCPIAAAAAVELAELHSFTSWLVMGAAPCTTFGPDDCILHNMHLRTALVHCCSGTAVEQSIKLLVSSG
jgi:hypothetical protein